MPLHLRAPCTHIFIHNQGHFRIDSPSACMFLGGGRELDYPDKAHTEAQREHAKLLHVLSVFAWFTSEFSDFFELLTKSMHVSELDSLICL